MVERCTRYRAAIPEHVCGEIAPLQAAHLEAHLRVCATCRSLHTRFGGALEAARTLVAETDEETVQRLVRRLEPEIDVARRAASVPPASALALGLSTVALLLALGLTWALVSRAPSTDPALSRTTSVHETLAWQRIRGSLDLAHLRLVSHDGSRASLAREGRAHHVRLEEGALAFDFEGGDGRTLVVLTPAARIEVVGTRFAVAHDPARETTQVAVERGRVLVVNDVGRIHLGPGEGCVVPGGESPKPTGTQEDLTSLLAVLPRRPVPPARSTSRATRRRPPTSPSPSSPGRDRSATARDLTATRDLGRRSPPPSEAQLDDALRLEAKGAYAAAAAVYRQIALGPEASNAPFRDLAAYAWARLLAEKLGRAREARPLLERLARAGSGEVRHQARLTLCELEAGRSPCAVARCLEALGDAVDTPPSVALEARRLATRWRHGGDCQDEGNVP